MTETKMKEKTLSNGWKDLGNGKYRDSYGEFWMCSNCSKIYRTERGYLNHIYNQRCKI